MTTIQKWFLIVAMWAVLLFLIFAFYWLQMRPVSVRKMCAAKANAASQGMRVNVPNMHEVYRAVYSDCCRNNGLKE